MSDFRQHMAQKLFNPIADAGKRISRSADPNRNSLCASSWAPHRDRLGPGCSWYNFVSGKSRI